MKGLIKKALKALITIIIPKTLLAYKLKNKDSVFLTFDDGPNSSITPKLLKLLEKHKVLATFFVIAEASAAHATVLREINEKGHAIGNHTFYHNQFSSKPIDDQLEEISVANDTISSITQKPVSLFRPPQGVWSLSLLLKLRKMDMSLIHWSRDSMDCREKEAKEIINDFCTNPIVAGDVVLFHDDDEKVLEVLDEMIPIWKKQNLKFSALDIKSLK